MSRKRWVYTQGGVPLPEPIEVTQDWSNTLPRAQVPTEELIYGGLRHTDGTDISTRKKHREFMRQNNLTTADDFTETWKQAEKEREKVFVTGEWDTKGRLEDIQRTAYLLEQRKRR